MTHESNGIDIITALILNDISPLCKYRMDLVLQLKVGRAQDWVGWHVCELPVCWAELWGETGTGRASGLTYMSWDGAGAFPPQKVWMPLAQGHL